MVWNRTIQPDTSSLTPDNLVGTDLAVYAGLEDDVDRHWGRILARAALTTLLGVGANLATPRNRGRVIDRLRHRSDHVAWQVGLEDRVRPMPASWPPPGDNRYDRGHRLPVRRRSCQQRERPPSPALRP